MEEQRKKVLAEAETELETLLQLTEGLSKGQVVEACAPLVAAHRRFVAKRAACLLLAATVAFFIISCSATARLHLHAVARIALVKLLPWWDWRPLHRQKCLVSNPHFSPPLIDLKDDCVSCEAIESVDRVSDTSYQHLLDAYLQRDAPVIVVDAMDSWPTMRSDNFWFDNLTQAYLNHGSKSKGPMPCAFSSNIRAGSAAEFRTLITKLGNPRLDKWFAHWLNCDTSAMKSLRPLYQRPYFLASSVAPAHFNWVLISSNYRAKIYKKLNLETGLVTVHQLRGSTQFHLLPIPTCEKMCNDVAGTIYEGETLVFVNFLWNFEYSPGRGAENIAIVTETNWDTFTVY
ncbi:uncharacterized protein LOC132202180 [Neocloeon triangulifer]|uniref:uncharacterized protein LOC132202180 n=1 Tax=Neocloeon triangulifer TaxID=2078957 RepID=UPI00286EF173|nr:uncharacterized protein LOC132202180 [Neocloeon triangulifer]